MLLSACLIVKDEQWTIRKCLDSLQGVADEIIVVDTGSTDDTIAIAQEFGAQIHAFPWNGNFSDARNESLRHASGDFILAIDADEYLDPTEKLQLRPFLEQTAAEGVSVTIRNYVGSMARIQSALPLTVVRVFRNGHLYVGAVHEQIVPSLLASGGVIKQFPLTFHHVGYLDEFVSIRKKTDRNKKLLEEELAKSPDDLFHRTNLMAEYARRGEYGQCAELAEETYAHLKETEPVETWSHIAARLIIFLIMSLVETGRLARAREVAAEGVNYFPWLTDIKKRYAGILAMQGDWVPALAALMECRAMGDPKNTLIDTVEGMGTYLAAMDLGAVWAKLGDDFLARKWYLQAFFENPQVDYVTFPLLYLLPRDPLVVREHVESRLTDWVALANYAEMYAILGYADAADVVARAEEKVARTGTDIIHRARMAIARRYGTDRLLEEAAHNPSEQKWLLLGLHYLELGNETQAKEALAKAGPRGEFVLAIVARESDPETAGWNIEPCVRDLAAIHAAGLLKRWLPRAEDRDIVWSYIRYSPLAPVLQSVEWTGVTVRECEHNVRRHFAEKHWTEARTWLERALAFPPTVTKVILECDLALVDQDALRALRILNMGATLFPDSELIGGALKQLHDMAPGLAAQLQVNRRLEDFLMNPADVYRTQAINTMPFNIQLSQLHERGALLTRQALSDAEAGQLQDVRTNIEELQNIITFLRSSLDPSIEVSAMTDQTYAYFYRLSVKWYLHPASIKEEYDAMMHFWQSWAETWRKVPANTTL
ncbi:MAG: glycosyltransferase [Bacilli bacterium]